MNQIGAIGWLALAWLIGFILVFGVPRRLRRAPAAPAAEGMTIATLFKGLLQLAAVFALGVALLVGGFVLGVMTGCKP